MTAAPVERMLGYAVCNDGVDGILTSVTDWLARGDRARWLACMNPHSYAIALKAPAFAEALRDADWLVPDGVGVVLASKVLGGAIRERVTGSDVFLGINRALEARGGGRVFFLGSTQETLASIRVRMRVDFPRVEVVGILSPPFKPEYDEAEMDAMIAAVNSARADVLWVGMTAPKQEVWLRRVRERLDVRFAAAIGAAFDFYTGRITRSSPTFQRVGLEWLPRLVQEPRRLWRRTFVSAPIFVSHVIRERATRGGR